MNEAKQLPPTVFPLSLDQTSRERYENTWIPQDAALGPVIMPGRQLYMQEGGVIRQLQRRTPIGGPPVSLRGPGEKLSGSLIDLDSCQVKGKEVESWASAGQSMNQLVNRHKCPEQISVEPIQVTREDLQSS